MAGGVEPQHSKGEIMWHRYRLVALTYFTRKLMLLLLGFYLLMSIPFILMTNGHPDQFARELGMLAPKLFWQTYVGFFLGAHLKQQFANPRAQLTPGFAGPHLVVAMMFIAATVVWAVLPAFGNGSMSLLGMTAFALHLAAMGLRLGCSPEPIGFTVLFATIGLPMTSVGRALTVEIMVGNEPILAIAMISAHVASLVLLLNHLMKLDEDDPDYSKVQGFNAWDLRASTQRSFHRNVALSNNWMMNLIAGSAASRLERATAVPATTPRQRVTLFGLGDNWPSPIWMNLVMIPLMEIVLLQTGGRDSIQTPQAFRGAMLMPMLISLAIVLGPWMQWMQRWARLGYESLRPVSRREWVWENGFAIARSVALNHALTFMVQALIVAVFLPQFLTESVLWEAMIWFTGCQVVVFGICAWLTSYGSLLLMSLVMGGCSMGLIAPWGAPVFQGSWGIPLTACLSLLVSLIGVWISRLAFKRWCLLDLP